MNRKSALKWLYFLVTVLYSCRENPGADSGAVRQELRQREIVHLSQGQITERAAEMGDSLLLKTEILFLKNLGNKDIQSSCLPAWDSACREIKMRYQTDIRRLLLSGPVPRLQNSKEKQLFEAYQYSRQHRLPLTPNLQKDGEKDFIYTKALTLKDAACMKCHSNSENTTVRGKQGDTLGIALLRFPKKQVVMSFVE
jgi:hypothetical protein